MLRREIVSFLHHHHSMPGFGEIFRTHPTPTTAAHDDDVGLDDLWLWSW
jgi:hypothetical protein